MLNEMLQAFILVFIAEMGDKTQILAIAFATRYPVKKVLLGIMIGAFLNHGIAVVLGSQLTRIVPMDTVQIVAGIAFVAFGIWSLRMEEEDQEEEKASRTYGAVLTVALAFFIGELGDKTQLAAITLAAASKHLLLVLAGTVSAMVATSCLGIFVGKKIGNRIPEIGIKTAASLIFLLFGSVKLYMALPARYVNPLNVTAYIIAITAVFAVLLRKNHVAHRRGFVSRYGNISRKLYEYYSNMEIEIETLCKGEGVCGKCDGTRCPVGNTRVLIRECLSEDENGIGEIDENLLGEKSFEGENLDEMIEKTLAARDISQGAQRKKLDIILANMERIRSAKK